MTQIFSIEYTVTDNEYEALLLENNLIKIRTHYGFLFQGGALFDSLSVFENIIFPISNGSFKSII